MGNILNISEAGSLALHAMVAISEQESTLITTRDIAKELTGSEHHLVKVLHQLGKSGLVKAVRGPRGGFRLSREPSKITLMEIFEAIQGKISNGNCLFDLPECNRVSCILGGHIAKITQEVKSYLTDTDLAMIAAREEAGKKAK